MSHVCGYLTCRPYKPKQPAEAIMVCLKKEEGKKRGREEERERQGEGERGREREGREEKDKKN